VVLKPDWLSVAIGFVLEDEPTIAANGLLPHRRLGDIWNSPYRHVTQRYPHNLQQMFLRLMERFELTYRVPELTGGEPLSLVAQLVPADRPNLDDVWTKYRQTDPELLHVCHIVERDTGRSVLPEGLIHRLIVLFHRHSLGRNDVTAAVHWGGGMVLQDRYGVRALLTLGPEGLSVRTRGLNPQAFLDHLVHDVREYIESFWKGLTTRVLIPCQDPCGLGSPGRGLFDLDKLYGRLERSRPDYPCPAPGCDTDAEIVALLHGLDGRGRTFDHRLADVVRELLSGVIDERLERHTQRLLMAHETGNRRILTSIKHLDDDTKEAFSKADERLTVLMRGLDDAAADGPRLFSLEPLDRSLWHPAVGARRMRLTLWCEHSRLPVHVLESDRPTAGVYIVEIPREWWIKAAPVIKATSAVLRSLLPVSLAAIQLDLNDNQWNAAKELLTLNKEVIGSVAEVGQAASPDSDLSAMSEHMEADVVTPIRAEGGLLRTLHSTLRAQDITYADLRRVRDLHGRFLWVHEQFETEYLLPPPLIPTGTAGVIG